ncbi:ATP-binding protein [Spirosoma taeanense]|uniref:ATP-binding protein n=1 Tax=Spirosoma taeanense TaxID=2735870 RepID=A0A6M5Y6M2_9BACT|nr:ATP-binding protein [Spirosoma taeanense]QJW89515.1 ATP-binding protein [Spirosoma taeanense]
MIKIDIDHTTIDQLPNKENDYFEFKSSKVGANKDSLATKLGAAVSGFANSGGGYFIIGVDENTGNADGGIPLMIGRQPLQDWVDAMIHQLVEPTPKYSIKLIEDSRGRGIIKENAAVLIIGVPESHIGPHMMDGRYYIRAGAHTVPAKHFIVEAIRAKRFSGKPKLSYTFRLKPSDEDILQLGIVAITNAPAFDVIISLDPLPRYLKPRAQDFPIKLPLIDQNNPFFFDVSRYNNSEDSFGNNIALNINYCDLLQNDYNENLTIGIESTPPIVIGNKHNELIKALGAVEKAITKLGSFSGNPKNQNVDKSNL